MTAQPTEVLRQTGPGVDDRLMTYPVVSLTRLDDHTSMGVDLGPRSVSPDRPRDNPGGSMSSRNESREIDGN